MDDDRLGKRFRRVAVMALMLSLTAATGVGIAAWAVGDTNAFYMNPIDHYGTPGYVRDQPIANSFWEKQDGRPPTGSGR